MQARHGFRAVLGHSRARWIGCPMAMALAASALLLAVASPAGAAEPPQKLYLALGDSVAFGYSHELFNEYYPKEEPQRFEESVKLTPEEGAGQACTKREGTSNPKASGGACQKGAGPGTNGYVVNYFNKLKAAQSPASVWQKQINNGCPGETTDSLIGNGSIRTQMAAAGFPVEPQPDETFLDGSWASPTPDPYFGGTTAASNVNTIQTSACPYKYARKYHLHHEYGDNHSQLESALEVIQHENSGGNLTKHPVAALTLGIGANDILNGIHKIEAEVGEEYAGAKARIEKEFMEKGFCEHCAPSKYNEFPFNASNSAQQQTDEEEDIANPSAAAKKEAASEAVVHGGEAHLGEIIRHVVRHIASIGEVIRKGHSFCVNAKAPCDAGHKGANYTAEPNNFKLLVNYDPFGSAIQETKSSCEGWHCNHELLKKSNTLNVVINSAEESSVTTESAIGGCPANPQIGFGSAGNPNNSFNPRVIGKPEFEWGRIPFFLSPTGKDFGNPYEEAVFGEKDGTIQKYTNIVNRTLALNTKSTADEYEGKNGPGPFFESFNLADIHPTSTGYVLLANDIKGFCPQ